MRPPTACKICRSRKRKCLLPANGGPCKLCVFVGAECTLSALQSSDQEGTPRIIPQALHDNSRSLYSNRFDGSPAHGGSEYLPDDDICNDLVDIYFDLMHDKQHALFHKPTFIAEQRQKRAPLVLIYGILAHSARFSSNEYFTESTWDRGRVWALQCKKLFDSRSQPISITAVQTCLLLCSLMFIEGDMASHSLYGALAIRMVILLNLPLKLSSDSIRRETEIRVWWSVWMMDHWSSAGSGIPQQLIADPSYPWPMDEITYEALPQDTQYDEDLIQPNEYQKSRHSGLWSQMIPLTQVIPQIHRLHQATIQLKTSQLDIYAMVQSIASTLDSWLYCLPEHLQYTAENIQRMTEYGHGRTLVALHTGYHHRGLLLYYQFLHHSQTVLGEPPMARVYEQRCKTHAQNLSSILWHAYSTPSLECVWAVNAHLLVISSSVQLHTLLFASDNNEIEAAKVLLQQNFEMLLNLRKYWPGVDLSMERLRAFHRSCRETMETAFDMDRWMLQFLQSHLESVDLDRRPSASVASEISSVSEDASPRQTFQRLWYGDKTAEGSSAVLQSFL